jgi:hypothetical protein
MGDLITIDDDNYLLHLDTVVDGELKGLGCIPRNYQACPPGYMESAKPFSLPLIPRNEWQSRLAAMKGSQLSDIRNRGMGGQPIPSRDQNGWGYCWAHSPVSATLLVRALNNMPYVDLSAFYIGCKVKNYRNRGGFCSESVDFLASNGVPSSQFWPQRSHDPNADNSATQSNAAAHVVVQWMDLDPSSSQYLDQFVTCLLSNCPVVSDFNWWSHSVCTADLVAIDPNAGVSSLETKIWNSWGDSWSQNGMGNLKGRKALPSAAIALMATKPSVV